MNYGVHSLFFFLWHWWGGGVMYFGRDFLIQACLFHPAPCLVPYGHVSEELCCKVVGLLICCSWFMIGTCLLTNSETWYCTFGGGGGCIPSTIHGVALVLYLPFAVPWHRPPAMPVIMPAGFMPFPPAIHYHLPRLCAPVLRTFTCWLMVAEHQ